jgi:hypothetical protein
LERGKTTLIKRVDGIAHGLVVAAQGAGEGSGMLALSTSQEHLAAADGEASRRAEPALQRRTLVCGQGANK